MPERTFFTKNVAAIILGGIALLSLGAILYTFFAFPIYAIVIITALVCLIFYLSQLFEMIFDELTAIHYTLKKGFKLTPSNPSSNPEPKTEKRKPTGAGALAGLIAGGLLGVIFGPPGVILGGLLGALVGNAVEFAELQKKKEKQYVEL